MSTTAPERGTLTLWGAGTSRTLRAHWALAELGLAYETRPIQARSGETKSTEYTELTARQKIPLLQDGTLVLTESAAIIAYLSDTYADDDAALLPRAAEGRARCLEWCFFALTELDATALYLIRRHRELAEIYGAAPAVCDAAAAYFSTQMRAVDRVLADGRATLLGSRFSAADIILTTCLVWADRYDIHVGAAAADYRRRHTARPSFAEATARNSPPPR